MHPQYFQDRRSGYYHVECYYDDKGNTFCRRTFKDGPCYPEPQGNFRKYHGRNAGERYSAGMAGHHARDRHSKFQRGHDNDYDDNELVSLEDFIRDYSILRGSCNTNRDLARDKWRPIEEAINRLWSFDGRLPSVWWCSSISLDAPQKQMDIQKALFDARAMIIHLDGMFANMQLVVGQCHDMVERFVGGEDEPVMVPKWVYRRVCNLFYPVYERLSTPNLAFLRIISDLDDRIFPTLKWNGVELRYWSPVVSRD